MFIKVKFFAGCKKDNEFDVRVKEKAGQGKANRTVIKVFANYFKIDESMIRL